MEKYGKRILLYLGKKISVWKKGGKQKYHNLGNVHLWTLELNISLDTRHNLQNLISRVQHKLEKKKEKKNTLLSLKIKAKVKR